MHFSADAANTFTGHVICFCAQIKQSSKDAGMFLGKAGQLHGVHSHVMNNISYGQCMHLNAKLVL